MFPRAHRLAGAKEIWKGGRFWGQRKNWRKLSRMWSEEKNVKDQEMGKGGETEVTTRIK